MKRQTVLLGALVISFSMWLMPWTSCVADTLTLGILANRPKPLLEKQFTPLVKYLTSSLKNTEVTLQVLSPYEMERATSNNKLDLILTNPSHYEKLRSQNSMTGVLATLVTLEGGHATSSLGGVIFISTHRKITPPIKTLSDLKGRKIAIPGLGFLGGYQTQAFELFFHNILLPQDAQIKQFGSHDAVIHAVLDGHAEVGFIRTGIIESYIAEGKLAATDLIIINQQLLSGFPYRVSTRLYPEWPLLALPHVDLATVRRVTAALLLLDPDHPAARAAGIGGFAPPADYFPVEILLRTLRLPPFHDVPQFTLWDVWNRYQSTWIVTLIGVFLVSLLIGLISVRNRQLAHSALALKKSMRTLQEERERAQNYLDTAQTIIVAVNTEGNITLINRAGCHLLGYTEKELVGKNWFQVCLHQPRFYFVFRQIVTGKRAILSYVEQNVLCKNTSSRLIAWHNAFLRSPTGLLMGVLSSGMDITENKRIESELRESERKLLQAQYVAGIGDFSWDLHSDVVTWSRGMYRLLRYPETQKINYANVIAKNVHYHEDHEKIELWLKKCISSPTEKDFVNEYRLICADGDIIKVQVRLNVERQNGEPVRVFGICQDITERAKMEEALGISQERYQYVERAVNDGIWDWNILTHEAYISPRWKEIVGYCDHELHNAQHSFFELLHPEDILFVQKALQAHFEEKIPYCLEFRLRHKKGEYRWILSRGQAIWDTDGRPIRMVGTISDVTERVIAHQKLAASEVRLRATLEYSPNIAVQWYNAQGQVIYWNAASERFYGWSAQDALGKTLDQLIYTEKQAFDFLAKINKVSAHGGKIGPEEFLTVTRFGEVCWVEATVFSIPGDLPEADIFVCMDVDITARKKAQSDLDHERRFLSTLIQTIPDLVWLKDTQGVYLSCNRRFEDFIGKTQTAIIGKTDYDFLESSLADYLRIQDQHIVEKEGTFTYERWFTFRNDGHQECIEITKTPMYNAEHTLIGVLGIGHNITERKRVETILDHLATRYAVMVGRTFFEAISQQIAQEIGLDIVFIGEFLNEVDMIRVVGGYVRGSVMENMTYPLKESPCYNVVGKKMHVYYSDIQSLFPNNTWLADLSAESYIGIPLFDQYLNPLGIMVILHSAPIDSDIYVLTYYLQLYLIRITAELQRCRDEARLRLAASVFTHANEAIMITDTDGYIIEVNSAFTRITGYSREEAIGNTPQLIHSNRQGREFYVSFWKELLETGQWHGEIWNKRKNGEMFAELLTVSAVYDNEHRVLQYVALFSDITTIKEHEKQLQYAAHYDALTGLPNRFLFGDRLHQAMLRAQRQEEGLAVAYLDLDGFKAINDTHGHDIGDTLLVAVATRMKQTLRESDTIARLGGDEFVVILVDMPSIDSCIPLLVRLLQTAAETVHTSGLVLRVSASLGVTFYPQEGEIDADQLLRQADQAMYQAKLSGKNRYHVFDSERDRHIRGFHESLERIRVGLFEKEYLLYYQPKVNLRTGHIIGTEALIRWQHPEHGLLSPAAFLPVIEDHALAIEVGEWVIEAALSQLNIWSSNGLVYPVSVNVGARQLQQRNFSERVRTLLSKYPRVNPSYLKLEVLETSALEDLEGVSRIMEECKKMGVEFALDDFGTGYSSLTYLRRLPFSQIKLDQSFIRDMLDDPEDLAIVEGVVGLASAFQREVLAEGVETFEHGEMLLLLGCDLAQGYGISRPMAGSAFSAWAAHWHLPLNGAAYHPVSRENIPLLYSITQHRAWVIGLIGYLNGERPIPQHTHCYLSDWLQQHKKMMFSSHFQTMVSYHTHFHLLIEEAITLKKQAHRQEALARSDTLSACRDALVHSMKEWLKYNTA